MVLIWHFPLKVFEFYCLSEASFLELCQQIHIIFSETILRVLLKLLCFVTKQTHFLESDLKYIYLWQVRSQYCVCFCTQFIYSPVIYSFCTWLLSTPLLSAMQLSKHYAALYGTF